MRSVQAFRYAFLRGGLLTPFAWARRPRKRTDCGGVFWGRTLTEEKRLWRPRQLKETLTRFPPCFKFFSIFFLLINQDPVSTFCCLWSFKTKDSQTLKPVEKCLFKMKAGLLAHETGLHVFLGMLKYLLKKENSLLQLIQGLCWFYRLAISIQ